MSEIIEEWTEVEEDPVLTDVEMAEALRGTLRYLNSLRATMTERGYTTNIVGEDTIEIYKDIRQDL